MIVGLSKREVESQCSQIEEKIERTVDARVMNVEREFVEREFVELLDCGFILLEPIPNSV